MASLLPPGAFVITKRTEETIHVTAEVLAAAVAASRSSMTGSADIQAQLFVKDAHKCTINV
jgi:hypothetical protein